MATESAAAAPPQRRRGWLLVVAGLLLLAALALHWLLRPATLSRIVLRQAGQTLGLEISAGGIGEYRLRGNPQLVVRDVLARQPGSDVALFSARCILISVPWTTLRSRGRDLTIRRVEIDAPTLDLQAFTRWQASRPAAAETRLPRLVDGLLINDGRVQGDGWAVDAINASLPQLLPGQPLRAQLAARFDDGGTRVPMQLALAMTEPSSDAGFAAIGPIAVQRGDWRINGALHLRGRLHIDDGRFGLMPASIGHVGQWQGSGEAVAYRIGMHGPLQFADGILRMGWQQLQLRGGAQVPTIDGSGAFALGKSMVLRLQGAMPSWPEGWPALPQPLAQSTSPLALRLDYHGPANLSGSSQLQLRRDASQFDGVLRLPELLDWMEHASDPRSTPLPPITGQASSPRLDFGGVQLHGVRIRIEDDAD